jgi:hypothetical protein
VTSGPSGTDHIAGGRTPDDTHTETPRSPAVKARPAEPAPHAAFCPRRSRPHHRAKLPGWACRLGHRAKPGWGSPGGHALGTPSARLPAHPTNEPTVFARTPHRLRPRLPGSPALRDVVALVCPLVCRFVICQSVI